MNELAELAWRDLAGTGASLGRALAAGALAGGTAPWVAALLVRRDQAAVRPVVWAALLALVATPPLLAGYTYSATALVLVHRPLWAEALLVLLLAARALPAVAMVAMVTRPRCSPAALHAWRLAGGMRRGGLRGMAIHAAGPFGARLVWALAAGTLAFADVELASLLGREAWTVTVFDAQAGGEPLDRTLARCAVPVALQLAALAAALALARHALVPADHAPEEAAPERSACGAVALALAFTTAVGVPAFTVMREAWAIEGWGRIAAPMVREIAASALFALASAACAGAIAHRAGAGAVAIALALPGLLGALPLSLAIAACCRLPIASLVRTGPLPLLAAQVVWLLPAALVLERLASATVAPASRTLGRHLAGSPDLAQRRSGQVLAWQLGGRARGIAAFVLFGLAYGELPAGAVLAPTGFAPCAARLYNLAHYGRSATLSGMFALALVPPLALALVGRAILAPRRA